MKFIIQPLNAILYATMGSISILMQTRFASYVVLCVILAWEPQPHVPTAIPHKTGSCLPIRAYAIQLVSMTMVHPRYVLNAIIPAWVAQGRALDLAIFVRLCISGSWLDQPACAWMAIMIIASSCALLATWPAWLALVPALLLVLRVISYPIGNMHRRGLANA